MAAQVNGFFPGELLPTTTLGGCIDVFENAWPNPKETIEAMEKECNTLDSGARWERAGTIGDGVNQTKRTNYLIPVTEAALKSNSVVAQNVHNQMYMVLLAATIPYARKHDIDQMFHEGYSMLRYTGGQEYKAHADGTTAMGRAISAIVYLNDDFEGGEVEFVNFGVKIKPKPGMLLLFPSTYPYTHIAHPVISGTKYAIVTWIHDRPL
jgi:predicted 2-oxoglutarate/Fe(II)-dependent dioxygenase YbiX